jgi:signal transduction histidine kinase
VYQNEQIGELRLAPRAPGETFSSADRALLNDLARQAGIAASAVLLTIDLQRLAGELQHSRTQLVTTREEERRRLRRDLHDGIGPALAGLTLKTETARALLPPGTDGASRQLQDLGEEIRRTVLDVRRIVEGLRPPALDELGLAGACAQAVDRLTAGTDTAAGVQTAGDLPALPAAVEVAAYRIVVEAVTNTVKHAQARHCQVCISFAPPELAVTITDDGTGLAPAGRHGNGLAIMRERAEELGGTVTIRSGAAGVTVESQLPTSTIPAHVPAVPAVPA